jgi:two-component system chemotaxis sensor kinase CheA
MAFDQRHSEVLDLLESLLERLRGWEREVPGLRDLDDWYRQLHTLKGLVLRRYGGELDEQIHDLESVLDALRCSRLDPTSEVRELLVEAVSGLRTRITDSGPLADCALRLRAAVEAQREQEAFPPGLELPQDLARQLSQFERAWLVRAAREARTVVLVHAELSLLKLDRALPRFQERVHEAGGEVVSSVPGPLADLPDQILFSVLTCWGTPPDSDQITRWPEVRSVETVYTPPESGGDPEHTALRLDAGQIDCLLESLSEMRQLRSVMADQLQRAIAALPASEGAVLRQRLRRENRLFFDVLRQSLQLRLVQLSSLERWLRGELEDVVRVAGVRARLELELGSVQLDRNLVEALHGPLLHLLRNAVDHGIAGRAANDREEPGASHTAEDAGRVRIVASQQGAVVQISVEDNGSGIDLDALRGRAERAGLVRDGASATRQELLACLFEPGFSSRDAASELSGRGVGLDAVRSFVARVGGSVSVSTEPGRGTTVTLEVPATIGMQRVQLARMEAHLIGVPIRVVGRTDRVDSGWELTVQLGALGATLAVDQLLEQAWVAVYPLGAQAGVPDGVLGAFEHGVSSEVGFLVDPVVLARSGQHHSGGDQGG